MAAGPSPLVVTFRRRTPRNFVLTGVGSVAASAVVVWSLAAEHGTTDLAAVLVPAVFVLVALNAVLVAFILMTGRPHTWDLYRGTVTFKRRTYAFSEITRVVRVDGARGWRGLLFCTADGRVPGMAVNIRGGLWQQMGREHWVALRVLLAAPHEPSFEVVRIVVGPGDVDRRAPLASLRGVGAVSLIDAQIGWIDGGGSPMSFASPVEQFNRTARSRSGPHR